ncbi:MAG: HupE/UreJ family protein [Hyphomicrobiales bacterium]|nr:HupE/UreJ family protein [Hyphomicrobiales bacterium]
MQHHALAATLRQWIKTAVVTLVLVASAAAHDIPADVRLNIFVKPAGNRLELLIRAPLAAMIEAEFPLRGPGYLDISRADEAVRNAAKLYLIDNITVFENDRELPAPRIVEARISLASDRSFGSYEQARAHVAGARLADNLDLYWNQQLLDVLLEYPIQSQHSEFAIHPRVDRFGQRVSTALRFLPPDGATRAFELHGDPGLVRLDPRWQHAAWGFLVSGFWHILEGIDHLLFLLCLVIPFRQLRPLVVIVTSFTLGHSISLIASALGFAPDGLWFPPLVETLIALTILYMALENIVYAALGKLGTDLAQRWVIAFAFGIVHGFGFSFALRESLQFAGDHLLTALLAFNVGVEIGQVVVLLALIPLLNLLFRYVVPEWLGVIILSTLVAHTSWHWLIERGGELARFPLPKLDVTFWVGVMRTLMAALVLALGVLLANSFVRRWTGPPRPLQSASDPATDTAGHRG